MARVLLTGDRSANIMMMGFVALEMLRACARGDDIVTGDNAGVESMVRSLAERTGVKVEVLEGGKPWDARHEAMRDGHGVETVVVIHGDPLSSSMYPSICETWGDDAVTLVTPETSSL